MKAVIDRNGAAWYDPLNLEDSRRLLYWLSKRHGARKDESVDSTALSQSCPLSISALLLWQNNFLIEISSSTL